MEFPMDEETSITENEETLLSDGFTRGGETALKPPSKTLSETSRNRVKPLM